MASNGNEQNIVVSDAIGDGDVIFYDVRKDPFDLYGLYDPKNQPQFKRLPDEVATSVNEGVARLYLNTSGGRVRFATDSQYVAICAKMEIPSQYPHMSKFGKAGFDLYLDDPDTGDSRYYETFKIGMDDTDGYTYKIAFKSRKLRYLTINFPTYSSVSELLIGLQGDAVVDHGMRYRDVPPIVYYGSSITQGACASRPGNTYPAIVGRKTNTDFINLGFAGSGLAEEAMARYLASLQMSVFVADYDHNAPNPTYLEPSAERLYRIVRAAQPTLPYVFMSKPDFNISRYDENLLRRDAIYEIYQQARREGDRNVYFIDGSSLFRCDEGDMATVDRTHPNDYGFYRMAKAVECELRWIWRSELVR